MTRTFKISFPLPGRRTTNSPMATPGSQPSINVSEYDASPLYHPSPKAQEVLGAATPAGSTVPTQWQSKRERSNLRKKSSYISVTLADPDEHESSKAEEEFPFPGMHTPSMMSSAGQSSHLPHPMNRHGSSPLLGDNPAIGSTQSPSDYFTTDTSPRPEPRHASSLSNLRSYYDKAKSPLSVSQQTSDFSSREMPLGDWDPPMTRSMTMSNIMRPEVPQRTHSRNHSAQSKGSDGSNRLPGSTKIAGTPRRRPSVNDPPTLYPNVPRVFSHAVSPPPALINASLPSSMQAMHPNKPRWWDRRKPKLSPPVESLEKFQQNPLEEGIPSAKVNVRRPKPGVHNWFDALDTDESSLDNTSESEVSRHQLQDVPQPQPPKQEQNPLSIHEIMAQEPPRSIPLTNTRKSSFSSKSKRSGPSDRKLSFKLDESTPECPRATNSTRASSLQSSTFTRASTIRTIPSSPTERTEISSRSANSAKSMPMARADLQLQSVLNLSSSEDEEETEGESSAPESSSFRRHRIRASIERADYGNEVLLGSALRVQPVKPKPVVNGSPVRSSFRRSKTSDPVPPVPSLPSRPQLTQRSSSMRWRALLDEKVASPPTHSVSTTAPSATGSTASSAASSSLNNTPPSSQSPPRSAPTKIRDSINISTPLRRGSKLMSVTSEEETLLEAMREKRASIRATDFQKGFNSAMQLHVSDYLTRPKTAGADGRTPRSSIYSSRGSISPPLLGPAVYRPPGGGTHFYKVSLGANSGRSASTDNLTLEDAYPFPEVPSEPIPFHAMPTRSPGKSEPSPGLSFSASDFQPTTPSTRDSPLTPPLPGLGAGAHSLASTLGVFGPTGGRGGEMEGRGSYQRNGKLSVNHAVGGEGSVSGSGNGPGQYGHERRETGSSSVVMLDGVESYAAKLDEENDITGWAMGHEGLDRW